MTIAVIVLSVIVIILIIVVAFLGTELLKKFQFLFAYYIDNIESGHAKGFFYEGCPSDQKPGMRRIIIESKSKKKFTALIGMRFEMSRNSGCGFDPFGCVKSDQNGVAVFSTYLGKGEAQFMFLSTVDDIAIRIARDSEDWQPTAIYKPHWFQKIGIFD
ncbi:MAG: hypothetical protein WC473_03845 [Patescibacteria group bacterium]